MHPPEPIAVLNLSRHSIIYQPMHSLLFYLSSILFYLSSILFDALLRNAAPAACSIGLPEQLHSLLSLRPCVGLLQLYGLL